VADALGIVGPQEGKALNLLLQACGAGSPEPDLEALIAEGMTPAEIADFVALADGGMALTRRRSATAVFGETRKLAAIRRYRRLLLACGRGRRSPRPVPDASQRPDRSHNRGASRPSC
jgi:hypothetical protein